MTTIDSAASGTDASATDTTSGQLQHPGKLNRLEIWKPPTDGIRGYFDVTVLDPHGVDPKNIIKSTTPWQMRFDVWLEGEIWNCVSGTLCYEVYFERANDGKRTSLSEVVGSEVQQQFKGCEHFKNGRLHLSKTVEIPAGELPPGDAKPGFYDWRAVLTYLNPCGEPGVLSGYDRGHVQIWRH